jgi:hypothetical protein
MLRLPDRDWNPEELFEFGFDLIARTGKQQERKSG